MITRITSICCIVFFSVTNECATAQLPTKAENQSQNLSITVDLNSKTNPATIDLDKPFDVTITNLGNEPIRLWRPESKEGYFQLTLHFKSPQSGKTTIVRHRVIEDDRFFSLGIGELTDIGAVQTLAPGEKLQLAVCLSEITWSYATWESLPAPNGKEPYQFSAHFDSLETPEAAKEKIWIGAISSPEIAAKFVAPNLNTPHELLTHGIPDAALELMKRDKKWIPKKDSMQCTPLHHAARFGTASVVSWLVENGADVNAMAYNNFTPLDFADQPDVVRELLKGKPKLRGDEDRQNPLHRVAENFANARDASSRKRWTEIADLLRAAGAKDDLIVAIYLDDLPLVKKILNASPEAATTLKYPAPLRLAARLGRLAICKALIEIPEVDINDVDGGSGYPIATDAVAYPEIIKLLIQHKADTASRISYRGMLAGKLFINDNATLLHFAAAHGAPETVTILIDHGNDLFAEAKERFSDSDRPQTALDLAAMQGQYQNVLAMIKHPTFARSQKSFRQPRLDRCLVLGSRNFREDQTDLASFYDGLIEAGANPNAVVDGYTAIKAATDSLNPNDPKKNVPAIKAVNLLKLAGAEIDLPSAVLLGDEELVAKWLQKSPASAREWSAEGIPALHLAVRMNHPKIVTQLLNASGDIEIGNQSEHTGTRGETALHAAAFWGRLEIAKLLIKSGAKVNAIDSAGRTPLFEAIRTKNLKTARLLLENGAKTNIKDKEGKTPLDSAEGNKQVADLFNEFRPNPSRK